MCYFHDYCKSIYFGNRLSALKRRYYPPSTAYSECKKSFDAYGMGNYALCLLSFRLLKLYIYIYIYIYNVAWRLGAVV
jgi:hypothetical protein